MLEKSKVSYKFYVKDEVSKNSFIRYKFHKTIGTALQKWPTN